MFSQGLVGAAQYGDGSQPTLRVGNQGDQIISQLHGRYYEQAKRGTLFSLANQAAVSNTAGLATTFTGLSVANPSGSGKNLVLLHVGVGQIAAGAAGALGIMTGSGAAAGSLTPRNCLVGGGASVAVGSNSATIATPVLERIFGTIGSLATTGYGLQPGLQYQVDGSLVIPPGYFVASYASAALTSASIWSFVWEEVTV
ncbi:MAG: hypothetical protein RLZZ373_1394 [Pseudomonadota bacterium]|jgi:hypothetical protein